MRRLASFLLAVALSAGPALAGTTGNFNVECYMTEPCAGSGWALKVDLDAGLLSSSAETLSILHVNERETQIVASGAGSLNVLSIGAELSLFTVHINAEPASVTYIGECGPE